MHEDQPQLDTSQLRLLRKTLRLAGSPNPENRKRIAQLIPRLLQMEAQQADPEAPALSPERAYLLRVIREALLNSGQYHGLHKQAQSEN